MKIAVYSGSFNPLHIGHLAILEYRSKGKRFDWVYLVVSPQNPFKDASNNRSALERYDAAVEAVTKHPELQVWVDDIELDMEAPHYTIRTLDALKELEPENSYTLIVGADNLESFPRWKDYERILCEYGIAVYPRKGFDMEELKQRLIDGSEKGRDFKITLLDAPEVNISSSEIREGQAAGRDMSGYLM